MIAEIISFIISILCIAGIGMIIKNKMHILASIDTHAIPAERDAAVKKRIITERLKRNIRFFQDVSVFIGKPLITFFYAFQKHVHTFYEGLIELRERHKKIPFNKEEKSAVQEQSISIVEKLLQEARMFFEGEDFEQAEKKCIEVIGKEKKNREAYHILGEIYVQQREWNHAQEVIECHKKILKAEIREREQGGEDTSDFITEYANTLIDLADVYKKLDKNDRAFIVIREAVELQENNPKFLHELVNIHIILEQRLKAEKALELLRKTNPENKKLNELEEKIKELEY
jgi:tetratricopeptide (TPR) repeat protein